MLSIQLDSYNRPMPDKQNLIHWYKIFKQLLNPTTTDIQLDTKILSQPLTSNSLSKVIGLDCHRTRSTNFSQQTKKTLEYMLSYFVRVNDIEYKQGLNEIAAPFAFWTAIGVPVGECYQMFEKFFIRFSLNFYYDKNFTGVEMFFRMISIVLRYHCPQLSRYLEVYDIEPQLYALSWLMTLFSSKLSLQMTYLLWSYLIAENDRYLLFFIVVGIIIRRKNEIIQTQNSSIFKIVTDMIFKSEEQLEEVLKISLILRKNTPLTLTKFFQEKQLFNRLECYKESAQLLEHINKLNLFLILPQQLQNSKLHHPQKCQQVSSCPLCAHTRPITVVKQLLAGSFLNNLIEISNDIKKINKNIEYVIIDLRKQQSRLNSFGEVHSVDIGVIFQQIEGEFLNSYMQARHSKHFVILLTGFTFEDISFSDAEEFKCAKKFLQVLNSYSFPFLGILQGGYTALSIYEQEFRIKQGLQPFSHHQNYHQTVTKKQGYPHNELPDSNPLLKSEHQLTLSINLLFELADMKYRHKLKIFHGKEKTLTLITDCFLIIIQDKEGFLTFMSFLQHNCSIMPYLLSHFKNVTCTVLKVLPIFSVRSLKAKKESQNILVIQYRTQKKPNKKDLIEISSLDNRSSAEFSLYLLESFKEILLMKDLTGQNSIHTVKSQQHQMNQKQKKIELTLKDEQTLKEMSNAVEKVFKLQLRKKYQLQQNKK